MIDLAFLRENQELCTHLLLKKDPHFSIERLIELDLLLRAKKVAVEELRTEKNSFAKQAQSGITQEIREKSSALTQKIGAAEKELELLEKDFKDLYLTCPNIPFADLPSGNKESNTVIKIVGEKPEFNFTPLHHVDLGNALGWFDFAAATRMTGSNFALYKGDAVLLMYALTQLMLKNNMEHGFSPILPPYLVNEKSLEGTGNFPKFKDQVYNVTEDALYLTPTAEVNLTNYYRDTIFAPQDLPVRMTAWTSCFRREAGTYGATERGLIRIHQFEKVELVSLVKPENSSEELDRMVACAESILQKLGLHYRISLLAAQDCSFSSAKTYDIEVWMPGQNAYYEVSSCSNCTDFQSRRCAIRYKPEGSSKNQLVHTLNGSSLALPRLMVALMETYQQEDGSIVLPDILKKNLLGM